jgi:predicted transcriptional regulator
MPGRSSRYTAAQNAALEVATLAVVTESERPLTIEEIQHCDMSLIGHSQQKMSRILNSLVDKGFVCKFQNKEKGRMVYSKPEW